MMTFPWKSITIHHSLTRDSNTVSWGAIRRYHKEVRGWRDIGYHAGIEKVGGNYELFMGRPLDMHGAHTRGLNKTALGFCFVGNYDLSPPPVAMMIEAARLCLRPWMKLFDIDPQMIEPHSDYAPKTCPGSQFSTVRLIEIVAGLPEADIDG